MHRLEAQADLPVVEALADRIAAARRLREHHLWEILRTLPSLAEARDDADVRHRFRALMERDDFLAASQALVDAARPVCHLDQLVCLDGSWVARILSNGAIPRAVAVHSDRVAAVMAALVALDRPGPVKH
ncbi:MAG: hypothetical protein ACT6U0_00835 [Shinella sp.]